VTPNLAEATCLIADLLFTLRHLDLYLISVGHITGSNAESGQGHLLNRLFTLRRLDLKLVSVGHIAGSFVYLAPS
jgi:hypothetical protein